MNVAHGTQCDEDQHALISFFAFDANSPAALSQFASIVPHPSLPFPRQKPNKSSHSSHIHAKYKALKDSSFASQLRFCMLHSGVFATKIFSHMYKVNTNSFFFAQSGRGLLIQLWPAIRGSRKTCRHVDYRKQLDRWKTNHSKSIKSIIEGVKKYLLWKLSSLKNSSHESLACLTNDWQFKRSLRSIEIGQQKIHRWIPW